MRSSTRRSAAAGAATVVTGIFTGVALGWLIAFDEVAATVAALLAGIGLLLLLRRLVPPEDLRAMQWITATMYAAHLALMATLHYALVALGRGGHVTGDDAGYADLSWRLAQWLHDVPVDINWSAEGYLFGNFVWLETGIFYVLGPAVLVMKVLNVAFLMTIVVLLYDVARRIFSRPAAIATAVTIAAFPSLAIWTALNLKDAFALLLIVFALWASSRFADRPAWRWLLASLVMLVLLESVRRYIFLLLALLIPVGIVLGVARTIGWRSGARYIATALGVCGVLTAASGNGVLGLGWVGTEALLRLETGRAWMAASARTAIESDTGRPIIAKPGDTFVVVADPTLAPTTPPPMETAAGATAAPTPAPTPPPTPTPTPRIIVVQPFTRIVLETPGPVAAGPAASAPPTPERNPAPASQTAPTPEVISAPVVVVRPNDIIIVAGGDGASSSAAPQQLLVGGDPRRPPPEIRTSDSLAAPAVAARSLTYLPKGYAYTLFAPFPWSVRTLAESATVPDVLFWYAVLGCALWTTWSARRRWRELAVPVLYLAGVLTILALAEGNVGTLYRHRAMAMPIAALLAGPGMVALLSRIRRAV